jgi:hypothetical protein
VILAVLCLLVLGLGVPFLPPVADHFGYARPVPQGLPAHFSVDGIPFHQNYGCFGRIRFGHCLWAEAVPSRFSSCPTVAYLRKHQLWPLDRIGSIPTLFGAAHPVFDLLGPFSGGPAYGLALVKDRSCFVPYQRGG